MLTPAGGELANLDISLVTDLACFLLIGKKNMSTQYNSCTEKKRIKSSGLWILWRVKAQYETKHHVHLQKIINAKRQQEK